MPKFFVAPFEGEKTVITGNDAAHISRALRMRKGDQLTLCDGYGTDYFCEIIDISPQEVTLNVLYCTPSESEPSVRVTLVQGLPKGDKADLIVQKAVELGASEILFIETARCIARLTGDAARAEKKRARWQKISDEAAGQSGRGVIPQILPIMTWRELTGYLRSCCEAGNTAIVLYEGGGQPLSKLVSGESANIMLAVGPEGGFEPEEIAELEALGVKKATLGKRILRCETAPLAALTAVMLLTDNLS